MSGMATLHLVQQLELTCSDESCGSKEGCDSVWHSDTRCGRVTLVVVHRRDIRWSDARCGGASRALVAIERAKVCWSDAMRGGATQRVVERSRLVIATQVVVEVREVWYSDARIS